MEGGKTANYWPGFVDALTNVVIAMVFVIVVLAIALSFAAQMMGKKMADELAKAKATVAALSASAARQKAADDATPPTTLATQTTIDVKGPAAAAASSSLRASERSLRLVFADTALSLDDAAVAGLRAALAPRKADAANARVQIVATGPSMALSDNQRAAYIRVLAVRNALIDEGFAVERIAVRIDTAINAAKPAITVSFPPLSMPSTSASPSPP